MAEPTQSGLAPQYQQMLANMAMQMGGPAAIPAAQRSVYLADALQQIQQHGGDNLRTGGALASNLLAELLDNFSLNRANKDLTGQVAGYQGRMLGVGDDIHDPSASSDGGSPVTASPGLPTSTPATPQAPLTRADLAPQVGPNGPTGPDHPLAAAIDPGGAGAQPNSQANIMAAAPPTQPRAIAAPDHPLAAALDPRDEDAAIRTVWGEARGEGVQGQRAVAGVIANRARMTNATLADIVSQPHQFAGYNAGARALDPNSPDYQSIKSNIDPILLGQMVSPAGNADHFYAPQGMPNGSRPSWDNGSGQMIGHQDFLSLGFGGKPPMSAPAPGGQGAPPQPQQAGPPPPPNTPQPGAPQAGQFGSPGWQPPPVPISQEQYRQEQQLRSLAQQAPQLYLQKYLDYVGQLHEQMRTPEGLEISRPNDAGQITVTGKTTGHVYGVQTANGAIVPAAPRMVVNGQPGAGPGAPGSSAGGSPSILPVPSTMPTIQGAPAQGTVTERDAAGNTHVLQAPQTTPDTVLSAQKDYVNGTAYQNALKSTTAVNALQRILASAKSNNGMVDMAGFDNLLMAETGLSAKQGGMQMLLEHGGLPNQIQGFFQNLIGQGFVPVSQLQQGLTILRQYGLAQQSAAQNELQQRNHSLAQLSHGAYSDIGVAAPQIDPMPSVPWLNPGGAGAAGGAAAGGSAPGAAWTPPPGWPVIKGKPVDPNSESGHIAQQIMRAGGRWNPSREDWE